MLARRRQLLHPDGSAFDLPLLVPAFSSKGFGFKRSRVKKVEREFSEVAHELEQFCQQPRTCALVSAYDIKHGHLRLPQPAASPEALLRNTRLLFVDSGGYELARVFDSTEPRTYPHVPKSFEQTDYLETLAAFTARPCAPMMLANYDHTAIGKPFEQQAVLARQIFNRFPQCGSDFILKPLKRNRLLDPDDLSARDVKNLRGFSVIGVTEKELGRDLFTRLRRVAVLRRRLDEHQISAPIHVWGGLEPIATTLFFFAGAEIVDGISWLRYAYRNGVAIVRESYCVLSSLGVMANSSANHFQASHDNLSTLERLSIALQQWVDFEGKDFTMFPEEIRASLIEAYGVMRARIPELGGS